MVVRSAVVGTGNVSRTHLSGIRSNPSAELVAVCDIDGEAARRAAREFGIRAETDVSNLLEEDIDAIHVCTPVQTHFDIARQAIEAGVAPIIEKPATATVEEIERLAELSREHDVCATVVHNHLFGPAVRQARSLIESGELGHVKGVTTIYAGLTPPAMENRGAWVFDLPGGEFEEGLPHPIYTALGLGGFPADESAVSAQTVLAEQYDNDFSYDLAQVQYVSADGALCSVKMLSGTRPQRLHVIDGSEQSVIVDEINQSLYRLDRDHTASTIARSMKAVDVSVAQLTSSIENVKLLAENKIDDSWENEAELKPHYAIFDEFIDAIENGSDVPVSLEQSRWTVRIMELIRDSARPSAQSPELEHTCEAESDEKTRPQH